MGVEEFLGGEIELVVGDDAGTVRERAGAGGGLRRGLERIPDHPGIDRATLEGGAGIGRCQEHRLDFRILHARLLQRLDQEVVDVGALVERDLLAFEVRDRFQRAVLRHEDRLALRRRRLIGDILERRAGGLREDRRGLTGVAEIDGADIECLEQRRARREFGPHHLVAVGGELRLQGALALEQHQLAVFLVADADHLVLPVGRADGSRDDTDRQHDGRDQTLNDTPHV